MHSTVQTGLYTHNIYNCDHNYHQPNSTGGHHRHHLGNHHHHMFQNHHLRSHKPEHGSSSAHTSLININLIDDGLNKTDMCKGSRLNLSTTNLNKSQPSFYSSSRNLTLNSNQNNLNRKSSISSISSVPPQLGTSCSISRKTSGVQINENCLLNQNGSNNVKISGSINQINHINLSNVKEKSFWDCSKPCGIMTVVLGILLLLSSVLGFMLLLVNKLCSLAQTCSNALVLLGTVSCLVIGIVLILIGIVIIVYSKKDVNAKVIITSAKNFDRMILLKNRKNENSKINKQEQLVISNNVPLLNNTNENNDTNN